MSTREFPLGRLAPIDRVHEEKYPLTAATLPAPPTPVVIGVPWYSAFDKPVAKRRGDATEYWIGLGDLGRVRGGHAVCLKPEGVIDAIGWWPFYDQGKEGACVGFACSRMMSLLNRRRYEAPWLYREAQRVDDWPGEDYSGTSVRAALDVLRSRGHRRVANRAAGLHVYIENVPVRRPGRGADSEFLGRRLSPRRLDAAGDVGARRLFRRG